jgi:hypothetical protein
LRMNSSLDLLHCMLTTSEDPTCTFTRQETCCTTHSTQHYMTPLVNH